MRLSHDGVLNVHAGETIAAGPCGYSDTLESSDSRDQSVCSCKPWALQETVTFWVKITVCISCMLIESQSYLEGWHLHILASYAA
jgi:hypothetical protein